MVLLCMEWQGNAVLIYLFFKEYNKNAPAEILFIL